MNIPRLINLTKTNSYFLFGARGTGKSTLIKQILAEETKESILEIDLLDLELEDEYARDPMRLEAQIVNNPKLRWVFIDEIQKQPKLLDVVHRLIENTSVNFILTGSSARKLKRGGANLLAGRAFVYNLFPFSAFELKDEFELEVALRWGTLPAVYLANSDEDRAERLRAYSLTYIKEEVQQEQLVRNLDPFRSFLEIAAQANGKIINYSAIAKDIGSVDHKTIQSYFQILEDTLLGFFIHPYGKSVRKVQTKSPKFYFFDAGVTRSLSRTLDVGLNPRTYGYGEAFEHFIVGEFCRLNQTLGKDFRLSYLRTKDDVEVDLIMSRGKQTVLVEIKSSSEIDETKVARFSRIAKDIPGSTAYWLSQDPLYREISGVHCCPWQQGLADIFGIDT